MNAHHMLNGYLEAAYFTDQHCDMPENEDKELSEQFKGEAWVACLRFCKDVSESKALREEYTADSEQFGRDFWFTRNGHGVGFWDRPEIYGGREQAERFSTLASAQGEHYSDFI